MGLAAKASISDNITKVDSSLSTGLVRMNTSAKLVEPPFILGFVLLSSWMAAVNYNTVSRDAMIADPISR